MNENFCNCPYCRGELIDKEDLLRLRNQLKEFCLDNNVDAIASVFLVKDIQIFVNISQNLDSLTQVRCVEEIKRGLALIEENLFYDYIIPSLNDEKANKYLRENMPQEYFMALEYAEY